MPPSAGACASMDRPTMTKQMFGRRLRMLRPDIQEAQRTVEGRRQWVYLGVALKHWGAGAEPLTVPVSRESAGAGSQERRVAREGGSQLNENRF